MKKHESENLSPKDYNDEYRLPEIIDPKAFYTNRREHIQELRTLG